MRILLSPSRYLPALGGIEEVTRIIAKGLVANGHEVEIWTHAHQLHLNSEELIEGIRVRRFDFPLPRFSAMSIFKTLIKGLACRTKLRKALIDFDPSLIHLHGVSGNAAYLMPLANDFGIPSVISTHGETFMDANDIYEKSWLLRKVFMYSLRTTSYLTAPSEYILQRVGEMSDLPEDCKVIPNGIEPISFQDQDIVFANKPDDFEYFIFAGRISRKKGIETLVKSFAILKEDWPEIRLKVCGEGEELNRIEDLARSLCLSNSIDFLGKLDKTTLFRLINSSVALVIPSEVEPFGMSALEAMSLGVPVIGTDNGGIVELCKNGALLVDCQNSSELSKAMLRVKSPEFRRQLSRMGKLQAENFTAQKMVRSYEIVYREIL